MNEKQYFFPNDQISHLFMWKAPCHINPQGKICLLLPSKIFLNKTDTFQKGLFSNFRIEKIVQLADMSFLLFENAICPAVITKYTHKNTIDEDYCFVYEVPKTNRFDLRIGSIIILPEDKINVRKSDVFKFINRKKSAFFWKTRLWGTPRDIELIERLSLFPRLEDITGEPQEKKRWVKGEGFKKHTGATRYKKHSPWWSKDDLFVNKNKVNFLLISEDCTKIGDEYREVQHARVPEIYKAPLIIINYGFSKRAFFDFDVLFKHTFRSISGPKSDEDILLFLTAVLNSKLSKYFLFHTAANWGTERDKVHLEELLRLPFPLPEECNDAIGAKEIINQVVEEIRNVKKSLSDFWENRDTIIGELNRKIEPSIYDYYEITNREKYLIEDTCKIYEPSSTPHNTKIPTLRETDRKQRKEYVDLLCEVLNSWAHRSELKVSGVARILKNSSTGIITLIKSNKTEPYKEYDSNNEFDDLLNKIDDLLKKIIEYSQIKCGVLQYLRGIKIFEKNQLHIIKPLDLRHWTRTAALNDADEIANAILSSRRGNQ